MASDDENDWVLRVLGVNVHARDEAVAPSSGVRSIWMQAREVVDGRLEALTRELRGYEDEQLTLIADRGLSGLTEGRETVVLTAALMDFDRSAADERRTRADRLRKTIETYRSTIQGSLAVQLVDRNPFGMDVSIMATFDSALQHIEATLAGPARER